MAFLAGGAGMIGATRGTARQTGRPTVGAQSPANTLPRSGALVALDNGQTIWIAPVNGKMQVIAANDYVIPRRDGFWRVRVQFKELPPNQPGAGAAQDEQGTSNAPSWLWAVPLKKGKDAIAWQETPPGKKDGGDANAQEQEQTEQDSQAMEESPPQRNELQFLSPDYMSLHTVTGEYSERYSILTIEDTPANNGGMAALRVIEYDPPISEAQRKKDLQACVDPNDELSTEDFLTGATEIGYGIVRARGSWSYTWLLGYDGGVARGYHTGCYVSVVPPKSMVGYNEVYPAWDAIKDAFPDAEDVFSSPSHDMILVLYENRLMAAPVQGGKVGRAMARLEVIGKPVMVQWALGKYVDVWTKELTPYFGEYTPKPKTEQ